MTRLKQEDITGIAHSLDQYDEELIAKTGQNLLGIARHVARLEQDGLPESLCSTTIGVVPVSCGEGIINGFADAVLAIINHIGFRGFLTRHPDISGFAEAVEREADIVMMADDTRFIALNMNMKRIIDNAHATGLAYAHGLSLMAGSLEKKKVLLIGCGFVGHAAARALIGLGSTVMLYDIVADRSNQLSHELSQTRKGSVEIAETLSDGLLDSTLIFDAAGVNQRIDAKTLHAEAYVAAPGLPFGLSREAREKVGSRLLHDPLQMGVAAMAVLALDDVCGSKPPID
ncbi:MAG: 3-methylornithyl-N6-L-lysine dehydrogenase PylD [Proteobacteria bacterium]|nr:3-methylornithyl-N6-L-lysine dehydrogenase PylD [Pseudomonadota bacterium]